MSSRDLARPRPMECTGNWTSRTQKSSYRAKLAEIDAANRRRECRTLEETTGSGSARSKPTHLTRITAGYAKSDV